MPPSITFHGLFPSFLSNSFFFFFFFGGGGRIFFLETFLTIEQAESVHYLTKVLIVSFLSFTQPFHCILQHGNYYNKEMFTKNTENSDL